MNANDTLIEQAETRTDFSRFIDMRLFEPSDCRDLLHCTVSGENHDYIQFMLSKAGFVSLNLLPIDENEPMTATVSYRLINEQEYKFII